MTKRRKFNEQYRRHSCALCDRLGKVGRGQSRPRK